MKIIDIIALAALVLPSTVNAWSGVISDVSDETPIFITIGQSNADGTAIYNEEEDARLKAWYDSESNPQLMKMWYRSCFINTSLNSFCWCMDGTGAQIDAEPGWMDLWYRNENTEGRTAMNMHAKSGTWSKGDNLAYGGNRRGMEGQFGMRYQTAYPGKELYIMKLGCGGSAIATWTSDDNHNWNYFYENIYRPAITDLLSKGKKPRLAGVWWMQGCKDRNNTEEYYLTRLKELIFKIRTDLGFPDARIYIGHIVKPGESEINPTASKQFGQSVRNAQDAVTTPGNENYIENTEIIDGRDCPFDDDILHWSHVGVNRIGDKIADRVIETGPEGWSSFTTPGHWISLNSDSPEFVPSFGNPHITYEIVGNEVTATLSYDGWSETKSARLSDFKSEIVYVKSGSAGSGMSWDDAVGNLGEAIDIAVLNGVGDVCVANGRYVMGGSLSVPAGITVTGGFDGEGDATIVTNSGKGAVVVLEGGSAGKYAKISCLTISGATSGRGVTANAYGRISNCVIEDNFVAGTSAQGVDDGAGVWMGNNVSIENTIIRNNISSFVGGGVSMSGNNGVIKNCLIAGNKATGKYKTVQCSVGGVICWAKSAGHRVINTTIVDNEGVHVGGVWIAGSNSGCEWINSVIWGNHGSESDGFNDINYKKTSGNVHAFTNCFSTKELAGITALSSENNPDSGIEGPRFVSPGFGNYMPDVASPLIDSGSDEAYGDGLATDLCLAGGARRQGASVDAGAYESSITSAVGSVATDIDSEPVYYDLRGVRIDRPASGGIYIERIGNEARKIVIR